MWDDVAGDIGWKLTCHDLFNIDVDTLHAKRIDLNKLWWILPIELDIIMKPDIHAPSPPPPLF
jgi:hypothetical protein